MKRWFLALVLVVGALLRLPRLDVRPMHTDEAVHGMKFGSLLETGVYAYDRNEYHGPSLNYFTLIPAWLLAERRLQDVGEATLRIVPAVFGLLLILLFPLLRDLGSSSVRYGSLIAAISPALVFYSRYYIQEMLLVCFTFAFIVSGYRLLTTGRIMWAAGAGVCAGLMHATKETCVIAFGAMLLAAGFTMFARGRGASPFVPLRLKHAVVLVGSAAVVSMMFFSSFATHWQGVRDSILAYQTYFSRAGAKAGHEQTWDYYVRLLGWWKVEGGTLWTEAAVLIFGGYGAYRALRGCPSWSARRRDLSRFLAVYALLMWVIYSALPYKTPWNILGAYHGLVVVAGVGVAESFSALRQRPWKVAVGVIVAVVGLHLLWQSYRSSFIACADPGNPYVYSHPGEDVRAITQAVERFAMASPGGRDTPIQVLVPGNEYWPLPWYLRSFTHVGWWDSVGADFVPTPIILTGPEMEHELLRRLYEVPSSGQRPLYVPMFDRPLYLRPGREIRGYVTLDLRNDVARGGQL